MVPLERHEHQPGVITFLCPTDGSSYEYGRHMIRSADFPRAMSCVTFIDDLERQRA